MAAMTRAAPGAMLGANSAALAVAVSSTISSARMAAYSGQVVTWAVNRCSASGWLFAYFARMASRKPHAWATRVSSSRSAVVPLVKSA